VANLTGKMLIATLPPKLLVNEILIHIEGQDEITSFKPGEKITGSVSAVDTGRGPLWIKTSFCMPYWHDGPLPMQRPYQAEVTSMIKDACIPNRGTYIRSDGHQEITSLAPGSKMESGDVASWNFMTMVPNDYVDGMNLWVLAVVDYLDQLGTRRATLVARRYDFTERRFVPVKDNPIYEGEE
jgi:hypothetical protein